MNSDSDNGAQVEQDYSIATSRRMRQIRLPQEYANADMVMYALTMAEDTDGQEPSSYSEAIKNKESA